MIVMSVSMIMVLILIALERKGKQGRFKARKPVRLVWDTNLLLGSRALEERSMCNKIYIGQYTCMEMVKASN